MCQIVPFIKIQDYPSVSDFVVVPRSRIVRVEVRDKEVILILLENGGLARVETTCNSMDGALTLANYYCNGNWEYTPVAARGGN